MTEKDKKNNVKSDIQLDAKMEIQPNGKRRNIDDDESNSNRKAKKKKKQFNRELVLDEEKVAQNIERLAARDSRTLSIRFSSDPLPTFKQVKDLYPDIKSVRCKFIKNEFISQAYLYFSGEEQCVAAMDHLSVKRFNDSKLILDYIGAKSAGHVQKENPDAKIDPNRLVVKGLDRDCINKRKAPITAYRECLKKLFPKAVDIYIPGQTLKKGEQAVGIVQFSNEDEAKTAFDASENVDIGGHKLTVIYFQENTGSVKSEEKRAAKDEKRAAKDVKTLFVKFTSEDLPTDAEQIKALHSGIVHVNTPNPRNGSFPFAFVEFSSEDECEVAKQELSKSMFHGSKFIVDYVGAKRAKPESIPEFIVDDKKVAENKERLAAKDLRTLFVKFTSPTLLTDIDQVKALHSGIRNVKTPRLKGDGQFSFAYIEFSNEEECVAAKEELVVKKFNDCELIVDFVGAKASTQVNKKLSEMKINPTRLSVMGLLPGATKATLKLLFPKAVSANIYLSKDSPDGVLQFSNTEDAKAAFDAAKNMDIEGHKLTVIYDIEGKIGKKKFVVEPKVKKKKKKMKKKKKANFNMLDKDIDDLPLLIRRGGARGEESDDYGSSDEENYVSEDYGSSDEENDESGDIEKDQSDGDENDAESGNDNDSSDSD